ncbi:MAG: hypothetical protein SV487_02115, partial [Thermodesulfobacteriota bacterium]|nr:hypothetical protein [Thermodesulfobacteriota bacterium]
PRPEQKISLTGTAILGLGAAGHHTAWLDISLTLLRVEDIFLSPWPDKSRHKKDFSGEALW